MREKGPIKGATYKLENLYLNVKGNGFVGTTRVLSWIPIEHIKLNFSPELETKIIFIDPLKKTVNAWVETIQIQCRANSPSTFAEKKSNRIENWNGFDYFSIFQL